MSDRMTEPRDYEGYIDEMGDERQTRLTAAARLLEWADGKYDGSGCVYCQFSEGHDADCLVDAAIAEARLNGTQRGLGLDVPAPTRKLPKTIQGPDPIGQCVLYNGHDGDHNFGGGTDG